ncbi:MAG TPA: MFS transporter [Blastocatellia bacterium]|jgi:UMF1 family MFS transporter|nr:MFS transporter [Blastocatellia bacterium]HAF21702.1 MFS transporter [Blastocatellia bacterium]
MSSPDHSKSKPSNAKDKNNPREVFGWKMYDWANSAFSTTIVGALYGPYLTEITQRAVGENGVVLSLGPMGAITSKSFFPTCISIAVFLQIFLLPVLGGIADYSHLKKKMMGLFCYLAVAATCLMFFVTGGFYWLGGLLFIVANLGFGASVVFYNGYLNDITTEDQRDKVSSRGFAYGYLGGGLLLALNFLLVKSAPRLGLDPLMAVRISLLSAGVWWGLFALITFSTLQTRAPEKSMPPGNSYLTIGFSELGRTFRELARLRHTLKYLIGYLFFNDGIQTVISMASVFMSQELFIARGLKTDQSFLLAIFLMVQFVAIFGALLFERLAYAIGTKRAILTSLILWVGVIIYGYGFLHTTTEAWAMGAVIAIVLGGSQALSRSLFSRMIPRGREASFFGIYEVSERGTSWLGPLTFGAVVAATNSYRQALLSLIIFFVVGTIILYLTDTDKAIHEAGNLLPEEAASAR